MPLFQIFILASIQGITEFIPISSSGHLILLPEFFDWGDQGLLVDVAVHIGTLFAVIIYFWRDIFKILASVYYKTLLRRKSKKTVSPRYFKGWLGQVQNPRQLGI